MIKCGVCGAQAVKVFSALVLNKYNADYWFCPSCQFLCTPSPTWLPEAYPDAISRADTGLVARNIDLSRKTACVLSEWFDREGRFLDTAGGTGLLTRMMRDVGFDFFWEDRYCANIMAPGFEAPSNSEGYEAITAFEVLEHLPDPLAFISQHLRRSSTGTLIFTTDLFKERPPPTDWWYYMFRTGQHISFFTKKTMAEIARRLNVKFHSARGLHLFTQKGIHDWHYQWILWRARGTLFNKVCRAMHSRTEADHRTMLENPSPESLNVLQRER